jgi:hypothetical protein
MSLLKRANGSNIQIVPVPQHISMTCVASTDDSFAFAEELLAVEDMAKVVRNCLKTPNIDGFVAFEQDRRNRVFLERVIQELTCL